MVRKLKTENKLLKAAGYAAEKFTDFLAVREHIRMNSNQLKSKLKSQYTEENSYFNQYFVDPNFRKLFDNKQFYENLNIKKIIEQSIMDKIKTQIKLKDEGKDTYELFELLDVTRLPRCRIPTDGIKIVPLKYHRQKVDRIPDEDDNVGDETHPDIHDTIHRKYPKFIPALTNWCRPHATTEAVFRDFNRAQFPVKEVDPQRLQTIMELILWALDVKPYPVLTFNDVLFAKLPLNTGTGYYHKRSYAATSHAKYSSPDEYKDLTLSKGHFINYHYPLFHSHVHSIKRHGLPFRIDKQPTTREEWKKISIRLQYYFNCRPTNLYTRLHISKRAKDEPKKARPVYGVDDGFLHLEAMYTLPLIVQARKMSCAIMHSLETLRGSNHYLDQVAQDYKSYLTIDYSRFDQTAPRVITNKYFTEFLPRLIFINGPTQRTIAYPEGKGLLKESYFYRTVNCLQFLHLWYNNMVFLNADGYAYKRTCAGVPSGLLNTQELDSFVNLFVVFDSLLEYGLDSETIKTFRFFVMGDDNSIFTPLDIYELNKIFKFIIHYVNERWNMTINGDKCIITDNRQYIETLSYQCNFGRPKKNIIKLCAQLCYPEHGIVEKYMSSRAIGLAYASCGQDKTFYNLCRDVYDLFKDKAEYDDKIKYKMTKYLPGTIKLLETKDEVLNFEKFPTYEEVCKRVDQWEGELPYKHKWDESYFLDPPNRDYEGRITAYEYAKHIGYQFVDAPNLT